VIEARARDQGASLTFVSPLSDPPQNLRGEHQRHNGALALALLRCSSPTAEAADLDDVHWPGRLERVELGGGSLWLDVAHNLDGVEVLCAALLDLQIEPHAIVFGTMADKPAPAMAARLREHAPLWWVPPAGEGSFEISEVAAPGEPRYVGPADRALFDAMREQLADGGSLVVCGSHFLVGAIRTRTTHPISVNDLDGPELSDPVSRRLNA
jgi:dihydrofolate synthase/folylpolyglutamate synthase